MQEKILALAGLMTEEETPSALLEALCQAAEDAWRARLKQEDPSDCEASFCTAAAYTAVADLLVSQSGGPAAVTAGAVTVKARDGGDAAAAAAALRHTAERLMAPYTVPADIGLRGVKG